MRLSKAVLDVVRSASSAALVLTLAPGCSSSSGATPAHAPAAQLAPVVDPVPAPVAAAPVPVAAPPAPVPVATLTPDPAAPTAPTADPPAADTDPPAPTKRRHGRDDRAALTGLFGAQQEQGDPLNSNGTIGVGTIGTGSRNTNAGCGRG